MPGETPQDRIYRPVPDTPNEETICYVGGTFDIIHIGHIKLLQKCRRVFDIVCVGLNTDEFNYRYKGHLPVNSLQDRMVIMRSLRDVDRVYINIGNEDSKTAILKSKAKFIVHGDDWPLDKLMEQMRTPQEWLDAHGIKFIIFPHTPGISTSKICQELKLL